MARGLVLLGVALLMALNGCRAREQGELEVRVTDHREAIGDFVELLVTFSAIGVHPASAPRIAGWQELTVTSPPVDLTRYVGGISASVLEKEVPVGAYDAIRLDIVSAQGILKEGGRTAVAPVLDPLALAFTVQRKERTIALVDMVVLELSDHPDKGYELHLKGVALVE